MAVGWGVGKGKWGCWLGESLSGRDIIAPAGIN